MKLTEAKLKKLIMEVMEEPLPEMITDLLDTNDPENVVQAIELLKTLGDPDLDGIEVTIISPTSVSISGDYIDKIGKLFDRLDLQAGHGGLKGDDGRPFITADLSGGAWPDEEEDVFYDEDGLGHQEPSSMDVNPHSDLSARQWKSSVHPKR